MRVLVTGGTGVVGKPAVDSLLERGHTVRLFSRHADEDAQRWPRGVEAHPGSIGDADSVRGAAEGCDALLHIAGIVAEDPPEITFERINVQGTRDLVAEAERAGVRRFVYVSSLGAERGESDYHRSKHAGEQAVEQFAGDWLILRPGNVYGPGDEVISMLLKMVRTLPLMPTIGTGQQEFQPIWAEDLGQAIATAVEREELSRVALDIAGPEVVTTIRLLDELAEITGKRPTRMPIPHFLAQAGAEVAETLGIDLPVKTDQLTMLSERNVIEAGQPNGLDVLGIQATPLSEGLRKLADALPEQLPGEGMGPLRRHRYWADVRGSRLSAEEVIRMVRENFASLPDPDLMKVGVEPGSDKMMDEGETLTLAIPLRGNIQVRVEEVSPHHVTAITLEGHPLSGIVRFMAEEHGELVRFEVRTFTRASNFIDMLGMSTLGEPLKGVAWRSLVEAVVKRTGGEAVDGVQSEVEVLEGDAAASIEEWAAELVRGRERHEAETS